MADDKRTCEVRGCKKHVPAEEWRPFCAEHLLDWCLRWGVVFAASTGGNTRGIWERFLSDPKGSP